ncbi:MAG TPA: hypothetical protein PL125_05115 [Candidatus Omnitrophota bacterium]|nr:hypothetical protein [Candidatus Omnitrophota bacterium]HPT39557.1 hypothetical protein [Candidatus Omnitrophota bacterium]
MPKKEGKTTKADILKKIEIILRQNIDLDAKSVFTKIESFLEPEAKKESFVSGNIGYVHIDEKRRTEYLEWEKGIKQEWLVIIESIKEGIKREQNNSLT